MTANPPSKGHWTYRLFVEKRDPKRLQRPQMTTSRSTPVDNEQNLLPPVLTLPARSARLQRFREFADATPNAVYGRDYRQVARHRRQGPDFVRVVVAVDPSGSGDAGTTRDNDAIGSWSPRSG